MWFFQTQSLALLSLVVASFGGARAEVPPPTEEQLRNQNNTLSFGLYSSTLTNVSQVVFPGYEPLDVWGPLEILFSISYSYKISLSVISHEAGLISSRPPPHRMSPGAPLMDLGWMIGPTIEATHTFRNAPALDVIMVPGGTGLDYLYSVNDTAIQDFINIRYHQANYFLSVCTGSSALATAGILDGRRATTNKWAWKGVTSMRPEVNWVPTARWVEDGNIWTSSGVAAGMDMMYAFLKHLYGEQQLNTVMNNIELVPHTDPDWDPFSVVHNVPGADTSRDMKDCFGPVEPGEPIVV
ncbi:hypothetical protein jhhlp_002782 [Lomentospora prolificans]|uniref:DJ-1/PfpI domain-containing protein n=1 Tax=Lomentospora prolificans TaxID=41688 RepID=A0A2N3MZV1_9PEZI|nr:hypothetical protein jhhlp_007952 [Lomentospora prolificans]PKS05704.1 hypothetical protein jhhlp_007948 [Lomentospora prolificans]PKS11023.1 hypothetical protein jhhlp_002782 [Lomentospora prolificans]